MINVNLTVGEGCGNLLVQTPTQSLSLYIYIHYIPALQPPLLPRLNIIYDP